MYIRRIMNKDADIYRPTVDGNIDDSFHQCDPLVVGQSRWLAKVLLRSGRNAFSFLFFCRQ